MADLDAEIGAPAAEREDRMAERDEGAGAVGFDFARLAEGVFGCLYAAASDALVDYIAELARAAGWRGAVSARFTSACRAWAALALGPAWPRGWVAASAVALGR